MRQQTVGLADDLEVAVGETNPQEVIQQNGGAYGKGVALPRMLLQIWVEKYFIGFPKPEQQQHESGSQGGQRTGNKQGKGKRQGVERESLKHGCGQGWAMRFMKRKGPCFSGHRGVCRQSRQFPIKSYWRLPGICQETM